MFIDVETQLEKIARGTTEIVPISELKEKLRRAAKEERPLQIKLGLDPTAPGIHIGNAVVLRKLRQFQDLGHEVTVIIGDFTAMIGDPTGKSETRKQLSPEEVANNARTYADQYHKILDPAKTKVVFNSQWLGKLNLYDLVNLLARTTVARILERDDFTNRFKQGLPIHTHELMYPICQGYDSVVLKSDVEIGGTEQRFNIMMGRDLQREHGIEPQVALFMPLLVGLDGVEKMSKSKNNAVGIDEEPGEIFGKLMSISDEMMPSYFELCTDVPLEEVKILTDSSKTHPKEAKKRLAREVISLYHGQESADKADADFEALFGRGKNEISLDDLPELAIPDASDEPTGKLRAASFLVKAGLSPTSGEAKRLVQQGGLTIDGTKITDPGQPLELSAGQVVKVGKHRFFRLI